MYIVYIYIFHEYVNLLFHIRKITSFTCKQIMQKLNIENFFYFVKINKSIKFFETLSIPVSFFKKNLKLIILKYIKLYIKIILFDFLIFIFIIII